MNKVYPARLRNLSGSPTAHPINSYALPDKLSPFKALTCYSLFIFLQSSLNINTGLPDGYIPVRQYYNVYTNGRRQENNLF